MQERWMVVDGKERCEKPRERKCRDAAYARKKNDRCTLPAPAYRSRTKSSVEFRCVPGYGTFSPLITFHSRRLNCASSILSASARSKWSDSRAPTARGPLTSSRECDGLIAIYGV